MSDYSFLAGYFTGYVVSSLVRYFVARYIEKKKNDE